MRGENLSTLTKWKIVIAVEKGEQKVSSIARQFKCSVSLVNQIIRQYRSTDTVESPPRTSSPLKLTPDQLRQFDEFITINWKIPSKFLSALFCRSSGIKLSPATIRRYRSLLTYTPRKRRKRLPLTRSQVAARHQHAVDHCNDDIKKWIFEDETTVYIMKTGDVVWVKRGIPTPPLDTTDVNARVRIWGVVRWAGTTFGIVTGTENQSMYIRWLSTHFARHTPRLRDYAFIHDHCSWHQTDKVKKWIEDHGMEMVLNPVRSPELNAIEYAWGWMKHYIGTEEPTDQPSLEAAVRKSFNAISQEIIQHDFQHVQHLMQEEANN